MAKESMETESQETIQVETVVKDTGAWAKNVEVTVPVEQVNREFDGIVGELASSVNIPGFRRGKVPRDVISRRFGSEIQKQATASLLSKGVRSAIVKESLQVIGEPDLDPEKYKAARNEAFRFMIDVEVKPVFEVGQYKGLSIEQEETEVLPQEMDDAINQIGERFAEIVEAPAGHAIGNRDSVEGELRFLVEGNEVHKEDGHLLVMDGHVMGAYAHLGSKFLEGGKVGEKRTVEETLAESFPVAEQRGKKATIEFEIKKIKCQKLPAQDDELAKKLGMKSMEELRNKVRESLLEKIGERINSETRYGLLDKVVEASPFELPKKLAERMSSQEAHGRLMQFARLGIQPEALGGSMEKIMSGAKDRAAVEMRRFFVLDAICAKENIGVSDEDIDEEIVTQARQRNMRASQLYDQLVEQGGLEELQLDLKTRKALDYLVEQADIKIVPRKPQKPAAGHEHAEHAPQAGKA